MTSVVADIGNTGPFAPHQSPSGRESVVQDRVGQLSRGQVVAVVVSIGLGLIVAGYGLERGCGDNSVRGNTRHTVWC